MNRNQRRKQLGENAHYVKTVRALTPDQKEVIKSESIRQAEAMVKSIANIINDCYFKSMRENRVGKERANRILARCEILIDQEANKPDENR